MERRPYVAWDVTNPISHILCLFLSAICLFAFFFAALHYFANDTTNEHVCLSSSLVGFFLFSFLGFSRQTREGDRRKLHLQSLRAVQQDRKVHKKSKPRWLPPHCRPSSKTVRMLRAFRQFSHTLTGKHGRSCKRHTTAGCKPYSNMQ